MDAIVVGAGVAGLRCARGLRDAGWAVAVLEKSRGVGGRCATRRVEGQPVDHGVAFLHGSDPAFRADVERAAAGGLLEGWPRRVVGDGRPCNRRAFRPGEWRCAIRQGIHALGKHLADGVDVRRDSRVTAVRVGAQGFVVSAGGVDHAARHVVLALPGPQSLALLETLADPDPATRSAIEILRDSRTDPCLTVIADYGRDAPDPGFDLRLPSAGAIQSLIHDSAKRGPGARRILVVQATPAWSRAHVVEAPGTWSRALLDAASEAAGPWAGRPDSVDVHAWRFARTDGISELAAPMLLRPRETGIMALTGELFAPGGGVQAAWRAGAMAAHRMTAEER